MIDIVKYDEDYDKILKEFEWGSSNAIGEGFPQGFIESSTKFHFRFSSKSEAYRDFQIILALDKKTSEVLAIAIYAIKTIRLGGAQTKVMQIIVVKVHPEVRHSGIATQLVKFLKKQAVKLEISTVIAKLNYGNFFGFKLFCTKFGFKEVSSLKLCLISDPTPNESVKAIKKEKAKELLTEFYKEKDCFPEDIGKILDSPACLGSFFIGSDENYISASLWNSSYYSEVEISQVLVDVKYVRNNWWYACLWAGIIFICVFFLYLWSIFYDYFDEKAIKITVNILFIFCALFIVRWLNVIIKHFLQARTSQHPRLKIFGVCYNNSLETKKTLLHNLFKHIASVHPSDYICFEFHEEDLYNPIFPDYSFRRQYLQKNLNKSIVFHWNKRHFIDPRE